MTSKITLSQRIENLKQSYVRETNSTLRQMSQQIRDKNKLILCIGAGVTASLIGNWNTLLNEVASTIFSGRLLSQSTKDSSSLPNSKEMKAYIDKWWEGLPESTGVLEKGEYLAAQCSEPSTQQIDHTIDEEPYCTDNWRELVFAQITLDASYRMIARKIKKPISESLEQDLVEYCIKQMESSKLDTLEEILELCFIGAVDEIIVYNFDTILEILLNSKEVYEYFRDKTKNWKKKRRIVRHKLEVYNPFLNSDEPIDYFIQKDLTAEENEHVLKIAHVHGLLDRHVQLAPIVFSEKSYMTVEQAALHWSSVTLAKAVREGVMVCVGFSGEDEDFRTTSRRLMENRSAGAEYSMGKSSIYLISNLESKIDKIYQEPEKRIETITKAAKELGLSVTKGKPPTLSEKEEECAYTIIQGYLEMITKYFKDQYNVQLLWVENRKKFYLLLKKLDCRA